MKVLHILPNERTADILRRAGVPKESIYAFPVLLAETDRYLWEYYVPNEIEKYDKIIVWHGNDANSLLLLALFCSLKLPLWHIDASRHKHLPCQHKVITTRKNSNINMVTMSEMGVRLLYGKEKPVRWWQVLWNKRRWNCALEHSDDIVQQDRRGLYCLDKKYAYDFCYLSVSETFQPMTSIIVKTLMHMAEEKVFVSETFVAKCLDDLAEAGHLEKRPLTTGVKERLGQLTNVQYEIRTIH
ncbi:MAG: hypothetical protein MJZ65_04315 [Paludibacteraceae bacterium]|nr:hypothetical protein [Paludibacteraceae bacterium]